jgi:hypothetical protein
MTNSLPFLSVDVPTYTADGYDGAGGTRLLTFSTGAPPNDGSGPCFIFVKLDISGMSYEAGDFGAPSQKLAYFAGVSLGRAAVSGISGIDHVVVSNYSFVADQDPT